MKSRKKINPGTVAGDKEDAGDGSDLFISTVGGGKLVSKEVEQPGRKPFTMFYYIDEPSSETENEIDDDPDIDQEYLRLHNAFYDGTATPADYDAYFLLDQKNLAPEEETCESCFGKWHRPLTKEPTPVPPLRDPRCYVACKCCLGKIFEENTADCAHCGSTAKMVLRNRSGHFDNSDKECLFYGKGPDKKNKPSGDDDVAASIASPQAKGKRKVAEPQLRKTPRRSLRTRGSSSGC